MFIANYCFSASESASTTSFGVVFDFDVFDVFLICFFDVDVDVVVFLFVCVVVFLIVLFI